jgi:beta-mannosidase
VVNPATCRPLSAWTLHHVGGRASFPLDGVPAEVPGCVHTDLLAAGLIPDPFVDANELAVAWVADADWEYRTTVDLDAVAGLDRAELVFHGLDTLATISLDGDVLADSENMHRTYRIDVTGRSGRAELAVHFRSATREAETRREREGEWPSASFGHPFNYVRKMACSWGWDWGPSLTTAGIWRPAELVGWNIARLASVRPIPAIGPDDHGTIAIHVGLQRTGSQDVVVRARLMDPDGRQVAAATTAAPGGAVAATLTLDAGRVRRWWPHGHGEQPRYGLVVEVGTGSDGPTLDRWERMVGFRTVVLDTTPDRTGSAFTLVVNGRPLFIRGVNWIPDDPFPSRVSPARYRDRLQRAVAAGADLVRVWGGGIYEDDAFYDVCDELGLLVWQDFALACATYPEHLLAAEVEAEARDNVARLMVHPSLVLWNGNNENLWGYVDWGWREKLGDRPWGAGFYFDLLPRVVAELDPGRPYWPGSPYSGSTAVAPNAAAQGCVHLWDVWNRLDHTRYRELAPRFVAEFGWQAPPTWATLRAAITDDPLTPDSPGMAHHQKAHDGSGKLTRGLAHHFDVPTDIDDWLWATHLNQARAVRNGVEHFRSLRGTCMGTIWWQLNDSWPVISWSVVDAGGRPKPSWYALRDAYAPRLLTIQPRGSTLVVFAVNDTAAPWRLEGSVRRLDVDARVLAEVALDLDVEPWSSEMVELPAPVSTAGSPERELLLAEAGSTRAWWWFVADRDFAYRAPTVDVEQVEGRQFPQLVSESDEKCRLGSTVGEKRHRITMVADGLVRDLALFVDRLSPDAEADRQLVTALPGEPIELVVTGLPDLDATAITRRPICRTANDLVVGGG